MPISIRSREDIVAALLEAASNSVKSTHIIYKVNSSYNQLKSYLQLVQAKGLAQRADEGLGLSQIKAGVFVNIPTTASDNGRREKELDISLLAASEEENIIPQQLEHRPVLCESCYTTQGHNRAAELCTKNDLNHYAESVYRRVPFPRPCH